MEKKPSMLLIGHTAHGKTTLAAAIVDLMKAKPKITNNTITVIKILK